MYRRSFLVGSLDLLTVPLAAEAQPREPHGSGSSSARPPSAIDRRRL
jgi:hypothetical protein